MKTEFYEKAWKDKKTGKVYRKPKKFLIYVPEIQEKIHEEAKKAVLKEIKKYNKGKKTGRILKAVAFGSSVHRKLGIYWERYQSIRYGSDIDLLVLVEPGFNPPKTWKLNTERSHSTEYNMGKAEDYMPEIHKKKDAPIHPINFLVHIPNKHDTEEAKKRLPVNISDSKMKGFKVEVWFKLI